IRDFHVTGVQTCALPMYYRSDRNRDRGICRSGVVRASLPALHSQSIGHNGLRQMMSRIESPQTTELLRGRKVLVTGAARGLGLRSEERRVGEEGRCWRQV